MLQKYRFLSFRLLVFCCLSKESMAQNAAITGEVTDPSGAAVVHAQVTLSQSGGRSVRRVATNQAWLYTIAAVPSGVYTLSVKADPFAPYEAAASRLLPRRT